MKNLLLLLSVVLLTPFWAHSQSPYNQYDELPGIIKTYKPAYSDSYPAWAQMLYQDEINAQAATPPPGRQLLQELILEHFISTSTVKSNVEDMAH